MEKLYLVRHTDIALKSIQRGFTDDSGVFGSRILYIGRNRL